MDPNGIAALLVAATTFITGVGALIIGARRGGPPPPPIVPTVAPGDGTAVIEHYRNLVDELQEERDGLRKDRDTWHNAALRYRRERDQCRRRLAAGEVGAEDTSDGPGGTTEISGRSRGRSGKR